MVTLSTRRWVKKVQIEISYTDVNRKIKIKSRKYFEMIYSFMKPFSQNTEVLTERGDVIDSKWVQKGPKLVSHILMVIERRKSTVKETLR